MLLHPREIAGLAERGDDKVALDVEFQPARRCTVHPVHLDNPQRRRPALAVEYDFDRASE